MSDDSAPKTVMDTSMEERIQNMTRILPVHAAPNTGHRELKVKRGPGRPRKVERMPTTSDLQYHAEMAEQKARFQEDDPIVRAIKAGAPSSELFTQIKLEIAREAASLGFDRVESEKHGRTSDAASTAVKRIEALTKVAAMEVRVKEAESTTISMADPRMKKIFELWVQKLQEVAKETMTPEVLDMFFNRFGTAMDNWEKEAADYIR